MKEALDCRVQFQNLVAIAIGVSLALACYNTSLRL